MSDTIKVASKEHAEGYKVIELSDFDKATMKEFKPKAPKPETVETVETGDGDNASQ